MSGQAGKGSARRDNLRAFQAASYWGKQELKQLPRYDIDVGSGWEGESPWLATEQATDGEWVRWEDVVRLLGGDAV